MPDLEIDATPVDTRVLLSYVVHPEFGRFLVRHEVSSIREHRVVRPSFGDAEISIPGIDAEGKIINIAGAQIANQHVIISIRSVNLYKYYVEGGYVEVSFSSSKSNNETTIYSFKFTFFCFSSHEIFV